MIEMDMPKIEVEENESKSYAKIVCRTARKGFRSHNRQLPCEGYSSPRSPEPLCKGIRFYPDGLRQA